MKFMYNIILLGFLLNLCVWLVQIFALAPADLPAKYNPLDLQNMFSVDIFVRNFMWTVGAAMAAGVAAILLRQNTYALYALTIFVVGAFIPIVNNFIFAFPNLIDSIMFMYPQYNPFSSVLSGPFAGTNPYSLVFVAVGYFAAFFFLIDIIRGGQTT